MKKISFLLLETVVVIVVITALILFGAHKHIDFSGKYARYVVRFQDIDGLSIGSPVRLSGIHVGHVVKQELKKDKIFITFKITEENVKIPEGSSAGVEFSGLGGSKSLEIKPPQSKITAGRNLNVVEPLRTSSLIGIQKAVTETTIEFFEGILSFMRKNERTADVKIKKASKFLKEKTSSLEKTEKVISEKGEAAAVKTKELRKLVSETCDNVAVVHGAVNGFVTNEETKTRIAQIKESTEKLNELVKSGKAQEKIDEINKKAKKINYDLKVFNKKIDKIKNREVGYIKEFNESLKTATAKMQEILDSTEKK